MPVDIFPYANIIVGILIFIVGFIFHWLGQLISFLNWNLAVKMNLQEENLLPEFIIYERGFSAADALIGWIYGIAAVGLILDIPWTYKLVWFPGVILIYHSLSYWFWTRNRNKSGLSTISNKFRIGWTLANFIPGCLAIMIAW
ncbi:MAG TPA: hypothetical protein VMW53_08025 [archaeon]|nr:hypothetical protein [archaeon]